LKKGYLYILLATILFSSMEIALKLTAASLNAIQLTFLRFLIGGLILLPLAAKEKKEKKLKLERSDFAFFAFTGFICVVVSMILFQLGILYSKASVVAVLFSCNSVFTVLFAYLMLEEKVYKHTIISILLSVIGMIVIIDPLHLAPSNFIGILFTIGAALTFALYNVIGRTRSGRYGGITLTCLSFLFGCAEMLVLIGIGHIGPIADGLNAAGLSLFARVPLVSGIGLGTLPGLLYAGIFVTGLGYTFYFLAMEQTSAATAALVFYIKPILAPLFAFLILKEAITFPMVVGILFILTGSVVAFVPGIRLQHNKGLSEDLKEDVEEVISEAQAEIDETSIKP